MLRTHTTAGVPARAFGMPHFTVFSGHVPVPNRILLPFISFGVLIPRLTTTVGLLRWWTEDITVATT